MLSCSVSTIGGTMEKRESILTIYDCEGTLQVFSGMARAQAKKLGVPFEATGQKALIPGMDKLICYTADGGKNVLLSGGNPGKDGCLELLQSSQYFEDWQYNGEQVEWGQTPKNLSKRSPEIAVGLVDAFGPDRVAVFGDSEEDYILAFHLARELEKRIPPEQRKHPLVVFFKLGDPNPALQAVRDSKVPFIPVKNGFEAIAEIQKIFQLKPSTPEIVKTVSQNKRI